MDVRPCGNKTHEGTSSSLLVRGIPTLHYSIGSYHIRHINTYKYSSCLLDFEWYAISKTFAMSENDQLGA
jgi:hypothetical protein